MEPGRQFLDLWHVTSPENAELLRSKGTSGPKPVGADTTGTAYEPGRGMGAGLYVSRQPDPTFGSVAVPVRVHESELGVPPERAHRIHAGMTPMKSLNVGDGYVPGLLSAERFGEPKEVKW